MGQSPFWVISSLTLVAFGTSVLFNRLRRSMGGYFALNFAMENPARVQRLILIGAPAGMNRWIPPLLRALGTSGLNKILARTVAKPSVKGVKDVYRMLLVANPAGLDDVFV